MPAPPVFADLQSSAALEMCADVILRCPGDGMLISHSIHLGRMATYYPPCVHCEHRVGRSEAGSPALLTGSDLFVDEGLEGIVDNQIHPGIVRKLALAVGIELLARAATTIPAIAPAPPSDLRKIVVAADGRSVTAELLAAASEGLRGAGCHVVELEPMTAPAVAEAILETDADGGFFIGNPAGASHTVGVRVWSRGARPMSAGGGLEGLRRRFHGEVARPTRISGPLERRAGAGARLDRFRSLFHALRPLRYVLDTASKPFMAQVARLLAQTACQAITPQWLNAIPSLNSVPSPDPASVQYASNQAPATGVEIHRRRLASLAALTLERQADFGIWIDGDGERLAIVDERGQVAPIERLLLALARRMRPGAERSGDELDPSASLPIVVEDDFDARGQAMLKQHGFAVRVASTRREPFAQAMAAAGSVLGGGPSGRLWFASLPAMPAIPDALKALGHLLQMLSEGDAPLSQVLDAAVAGRQANGGRQFERFGATEMKR